MLILLAFIIVFHITSAALLFISTIDNAWWVGDVFTTDVWRVCTTTNSTCMAIGDHFSVFVYMKEVDDLRSHVSISQLVFPSIKLVQSKSVLHQMIHYTQAYLNQHQRKEFAFDVCVTVHSLKSEYQSIQAVQATMVLSTIFCCVAFLVFILQLFRLKQGERFVLTSVIQLLSCLCVMIAASIYTDRHEELHKSTMYFIDVSQGRYGYSFVLAWIAFAFTLISGVMYLVLRKRK